MLTKILLTMSHCSIPSSALLLLLFTVAFASGQVPEGTQPVSTNIRPDDCPCLFPDGRVLFRIEALDADNIQIDLGGKQYDMQPDSAGRWTVTTDPQEPGFHYYSLVIDSVKVADPASETYYGMGRMASGIDIPEAGVDFYTLKEVPHGDIRAHSYFSRTAEAWRNINVYTPPGYDDNPEKSYPILYIQHGGGEDERGWAVQGKTNVILDNLIASGKAVPMIVAIPNGNATKPGVDARGYNDEAMAIFREELFENVIPFVEERYRVTSGAQHRALAGLSMGGGQTFFTGLRHPEMFASLGIFSTGLFGGIGRPEGEVFDPETIIPGILTHPEPFNDQLDLLYISVGQQDPRIEATQKLVETFRREGLDVEFASFPGGHEWQVWRKSLHDFAPRLFR